MLVVGPDCPVEIQPMMRSVVDAIIALQQPGAPVRLASVTFAKLPPAANWPYGHIIVSDKQSIAVSTPSGATWAWTRANGSAL